MKFFKKIVSIFCIILTVSGVFRGVAFAEGECAAECKIQDGPADILIDYISDVRAVVSNVRMAQSKAPKTTTSNSSSNISLGKMQKSMTRMFNLFGSWGGYYTSFEYYISLPLSQSVPSVVKRDQNMLLKESESLSKLLETAVRRGTQNIIVENACNGVKSSETCNLDNGDVAGILGTLMGNTQKMLEFYRLSILGKQSTFEYEFILVPKGFKESMEQYYNSSTAEDCSQCKGEFTEQVKTGIDKVTNWSKWSKNGTQRWIDAWNMLIGNVSEVKQREYERQVLSRELGRQGLRSNNSEIVLGNLNKYNNEGFSVDNNFITNSFNSTQNSVGRQLNSFSETILQKFEKSGKDRVPTEEFVQTDQDVQDTQAVENMIDLVYRKELPFAEVQDTAAEKLQAKLIDYHISLTEIIKQLDTIIPVSEKVCNDQGNGLGNCSY